MKFKKFLEKYHNEAHIVASDYSFEDFKQKINQFLAKTHWQSLPTTDPLINPVVIKQSIQKTNNMIGTTNNENDLHVHDIGEYLHDLFNLTQQRPWLHPLEHEINDLIEYVQHLIYIKTSNIADDDLILVSDGPDRFNWGWVATIRYDNAKNIEQTINLIKNGRYTTDPRVLKDFTNDVANKVFLVRLFHKITDPGFRRTISKNPYDATNWFVAMDWLEEAKGLDVRQERQKLEELFVKNPPTCDNNGIHHRYNCHWL